MSETTSENSNSPSVAGDVFLEASIVLTVLCIAGCVTGGVAVGVGCTTLVGSAYRLRHNLSNHFDPTMRDIDL